MTEQTVENPLSLLQEIDTRAVTQTLNKVKTLQATFKNILVEQHDYGKIPGCGDKPTLLKPGAEKIQMSLGLTSSYELLEHTEDFSGNGFFAYTLKCILTKNGYKVTEGLGHANSKEKKWAKEFVFEKDLPVGANKELLNKKELHGKNGTFYKYEVDADANSKANTILKMAKKRALVDAVLTVANLSDVFTQDFDDLPEEDEPTTAKTVTKVKDSVKKQKTYVCSECGAEITEKVNSYSIEKYGEALCFNCQKKVGKGTKTETKAETTQKYEEVEEIPFG